jgi:pyruvate-formate lyase-activating enzyme
MSVQEVMEQILADRRFYEQSGGGVTLSGGEPLAQGRFIGALLERCKKEGLHTAVETAGHYPWKILEEVLGHRPRAVALSSAGCRQVRQPGHGQYSGARLPSANLTPGVPIIVESSRRGIHHAKAGVANRCPARKQE